MHIKDFFEKYYQLYEELKLLERDYGRMFADRHSFRWATRQIIQKGISVENAALVYIKEMIKLKREVYLPCFAAEKMHEDSIVIVPFDVTRDLEEITRFVTNERQRRRDINWEPEPV